MVRCKDCCFLLALLVFAVAFLILGVAVGVAVASGGRDVRRGLEVVSNVTSGVVQDLRSDPAGFVNEVLDGARGFYVDPVTYIFDHKTHPKERRGPPVAWWDCEAELPCLTGRLVERLPDWLLAYDRMRDAIEASVQPEGLQKQGNWSYAMVWDARANRGCLLHGSTLCDDILRLIDHVGLRRYLHAAKVSVLQPGTRLHPHTGPRLDRLRIMLPIVVPPVPGGSASDAGGGDGTGSCSAESCSAGETPSIDGVATLAMHVGNRSNELVLGKPLCFNDAVRHTAWNFRSSPRVALLLDFLHPGLLPPGERLCGREAATGGARGREEASALPGPRRCALACAALQRGTASAAAAAATDGDTCDPLPKPLQADVCPLTCEDQLTWGEPYVDCLQRHIKEVPLSCDWWRPCERRKEPLRGPKSVASLPKAATSNLKPPAYKNALFYRLLNSVVYRTSDFALGLHWAPGYS